MKGIYNLVLECHNSLKIGSIGEKKLNGFYVYIGSAQGPGGIEKRINRHLKINKGEKNVKHWHIDYVLPYSNLLGYCFGKTNNDKECELANEVPKIDKIIDFGCSDCKCESHFFEINKSKIQKIKKAYEKIGLSPKCRYESSCQHQIAKQS